MIRERYSPRSILVSACAAETDPISRKAKATIAREVSFDKDIL
jgi:hypothetical protein